LLKQCNCSIINFITYFYKQTDIEIDYINKEVRLEEVSSINPELGDPSSKYLTGISFARVDCIRKVGSIMRGCDVDVTWKDSSNITKLKENILKNSFYDRSTILMLIYSDQLSEIEFINRKIYLTYEYKNIFIPEKYHEVYRMTKINGDVYKNKENKYFILFEVPKYLTTNPTSFSLMVCDALIPIKYTQHEKYRDIYSATVTIESDTTCDQDKNIMIRRIPKSRHLIYRVDIPALNITLKLQKIQPTTETILNLYHDRDLPIEPINDPPKPKAWNNDAKLSFVINLVNTYIQLFIINEMNKSLFNHQETINQNACNILINWSYLRMLMLKYFNAISNLTSKLNLSNIQTDSSIKEMLNISEIDVDDL